MHSKSTCATYYLCDLIKSYHLSELTSYFIYKGIKSFASARPANFVLSRRVTILLREGRMEAETWSKLCAVARGSICQSRDAFFKFSQKSIYLSSSAQQH